MSLITLPYYFLQQVTPVGCDVKDIDGCNGKISNIQKGIESKDELSLVQEAPGAAEVS